MKNLSQLTDHLRFPVALFAGAILGGFLGFASAQDGAPGQLDTACAARCTANGYEAAFCGQVCWIPDPGMVAKGEGLDWNCTTACRNQGGKLSDCLPRCQRR